jgi:hypothetical protein
MLNNIAPPPSATYPNKILHVQKNELDIDIDTAESEMSLAQALDFIRDIVQELPDMVSDRLVVTKLADGQNGLRHYFLPDMPGGNGDIRQIREGYDGRASYGVTGEHAFIKVGQGEMWLVPKALKPYLTVSMSECSTLIGQNDDLLVVAHISYSMLCEIESTVEYMRTIGIPAQKILAVASVGPYQAAQSKKDFYKRACSTADYLKCGIMPGNTYTFEYRPESTPSAGRIDRNITQVLVGGHGLLKWSADFRYESAGWHSAETRLGDLNDQEVIDFAGK